VKTLGWPGIKLRDLLSQRYERLFFDVYVCRGARTTVARLANAALAVSAPGSYASHSTAAAIWGAVVPDSEFVHVSVPDEQPRCERRGIKAHRASASIEVMETAGVRLSSPLDCLLEMAASGIGLVDLVVAGDGLLKRERFSLEQLTFAAAGWTGRGAKVARRAARLMREGVDSAMESRLRLLIVLAGLPEPEVNLIIRHSDGSWQLRFDLCYRALKLIIEYDGKHHSKTWKDDIRRREVIDRQGWRIVVVHHEGIYQDPRETLDRVSEALRERGARRLRRVYKAEYARYFPGRASSTAA
jgi:hypothetical protein